MMKLLCLLFVLIGCALAQPAQPPKLKEQKQDDATLRIETELLQLEVLVTDKSGKPVRDLMQADFELREDGKPQTITHFSFGTATRPARWLTAEPKPATASPVAPTASTTGQANRYFVLVVDDLHLSPQSLMQTRQALLKFVDLRLTSDEQVALITTSGQLWVYQQFTNKREILRRAINRLAVAERQASSLSNEIPRMTPYQAELIQNGDPEALAIAINEILRTMPPGTSPAMVASIAQGKAQQIVAENTFHVKATLSTLEDVVRSLRVLPGRKSIVLLSDGFFLGGSQQSTTYDLRQIADAATRAGVMIYSLDTRGLVTGAPDVSQSGFGNEQPPGVRMRIEAAGLEAQRDGLNALARDTGGFPIFNHNDLYVELQKAVADTEAYYVLAFEPQQSYRDGRFRKLEVRVKEHPDYTVRTSKGYFAPNDKAAAAKKDAAPKMGLTRRTFTSLLPARDIPVEMAVDFVDSGAGQSFATITAHLDISRVKFEPTNERLNATLHVTGVVYDEEGKPLDRFKRKLALALKPATHERMLKSGFVFDCLVKLKPGFYQVRMAATQDNSTLTGNVSDWVEIGDLSKKELLLSSIFVAAEGERLNIVPPQNEPVEAEKKGDDVQATAMPTQISRRFKRGAKFDYLLFAYNPQAAPNGALDLVVQTQLYSGNKVVYASPLAKLPPAEKQNVVPYRARLSLDHFEPGTYELRVQVIDHVTKTTAKRSLNFVVEP
jgi:VWFA-related protein